MANTRKRMVIISIDSIAELLKDYLGEDTLPRDAMAQRLLINPQENGRIALEVASPSIKADAKDIFVNFDIKRIYSV